MRAPVKTFAELCSQELPVIEPIYEFGALQVPEQGNYGDLRPYYPGRAYIGADMQAGPGVDTILDLHNIELPDEVVGTVLMYEILEHVERPWNALQEVFRILKTDGYVIATSQMDYPIHSYPSDYWRFTPEGFRTLVKQFGTVHVGYAGRSRFPHMVYLIAFKAEGQEERLQGLLACLPAWQSSWESPKGRLIPRIVDRTRLALHPLMPLPVLVAYRYVKRRFFA